MLRFYPLALLGILASAAPLLAQTPVVTARSPARNANGAARATDVAVTFSQPISAATAAATAIYSAQAGGRKAGAYATSGATITFNPTVDFKPGETVLVSVPAAVQGTNGVPAARQVHQFTTAVSGTGRGNFRAGTDVASGTACMGLATGDVDGDGDLDFVTVNQYGSGGILVFQNGGNASGSNTGVFSSSQSVPFPFAAPRMVALADIDGDGDLDLLVAADVVYTFLNGGNGSGSNTGVFSAMVDVAVGRSPYSIALGDVDGDGDLDLLTANYAANTVSVRLNGGDATGSSTGIFSLGTEVPVGNSPGSVAVADVDNDGDLDILAANNSIPGTVSIRLNGGNNSGSNTGLFSGAQDVVVGGPARTLAVADVDGDGDLDFVTGNNVQSGGQTASVRLNGGDATGSGTGVFGGTQEVSLANTALSIALGDVDGDGDLDLVASEGGTTAEARLNGGNASGSNTGLFAGGAATTVGNTPYNLALADVDGDGDLDLLTTNYGVAGNGSTVSIRLNQPPAPVISSLNPGSAVAGTTVTLTGTNLLGATLVVNGRPVTVVTNTGTSLTFVVPAGATAAGTVAVTTPGGSTTAAFTVLLAVVNTSPLANSLTAPRTNSAVNVTFSEPITAASAGNVRVFSAQAGGRKAGTTNVVGNNLFFTATASTPRTNFTPGEVVSVTVPAAITSVGGIGAVKKVFRFNTPTSGSGRGNFQPGSDVVVYAQPYGVTTADVDGDGDQDMIAATYGSSGTSNQLSVRLNNGNGTFTYGSDPTVYGNGSGVIDVTAADVDGDGDLDLLTANFRATNVSVLINDGTGTFALGASPSINGPARRVITADVDGDGDLDLLTANSGTNGSGSAVSVRLNTGTGNFLNGSEVPVGTGVTGVTTADVDGDGDLDLLTANAGTTGNGNTVSVRLNNGNGVFSGGSDPVVGAGPVSITAADVDGDGDLDFITANAGTNWTGNTVSVRFNNGSGIFSGTSNPTVGAGPSVVTTADVDADGDLDLLTANYATNTVSVRLNDGTGTFSGGSDPVVDTSTFTQYGSQGLALADLDGDGDLDLLSANSGNQSGSTVSVRLNQAPSPTLLSFTPTSGLVGTQVVITGTNLLGTTAVNFTSGAAAAFTINSATQLTATVPAAASTGPISVTASGVVVTSSQVFTLTNAFTIVSTSPTRNQRNAPRNANVAIGFNGTINAASPGILRVFGQQAGGRKAGTTTFAGSTLTFAPTAGFKPGEVVMTTQTTGIQSTSGLPLVRGQVFQFMAAAGNGSGTFAPAATVPVGMAPFAVLAADMNGDGLVDVVSGNTGNNTVSIRFNTGSGTAYTGTVAVPMPTDGSLGIADLDSDGDLDLFSTSGNNQQVTVRLNNGLGTVFATSNGIPIGSGAGLVAAVDINADGFLDLVAANYFTGTVSIRFNNGSGAFTGTTDINMSTTSTTYVSPTAVTVADVDADGDWDLVVSNRNPNSLSIRLNNGAGVFSGGSDMALPFEPSLLRTADLNGDGVLDLLVAYAGSLRVQSLLGTAGGFTLGSIVFVGTNPRALTAGDIDGDGDVDFATANTDVATVSVRVNDGNGNFSGTTTLPVGTNPAGLAFADMDGDTDLDLLVGSYNNNNVTVLLNQGTPTATRNRALAAQVELYPVPARGHFNLSIPAIAGNHELVLTLFNAVGAAVLRQSLSLPNAATIAVDAAQLPPGLYTLQGLAGGQVFTKRVVLE